MAATLDLAVRLRDQASGNFNKISGTVANFNQQLDTAREKINKFSDGMANVGTKMSAFVTAPILGLGGAMLKAAADQEQLDVAFKTMLGSAEKAKKLMEELKTFSAETPFEMPEVVDAGRQLLAYGIEADNVQDTLRMLGDVAAGTGSRIGDLAYLFGTAKAQGRLFATDVNQFAGRGIPIFKALAETMGVAESAVKELVSEGKVGFPEMQAAFEYMTASGSQFGGMMEAQSQTLGGLFSTLKDNLTITLTEVGLKLVDTFNIREKASDALEFVDEMRGKLLSFIDANPELIRTGAIFAGIAAAIGPALLALSGLVKAVGLLIPGIQALGAAIAFLTGPLGLVVAGFGLLVTFNVGGIRDKFVELGSAINIVSQNIDKLGPIASDAKDAMQWIWEGKADNIDWWNDITDGFVNMGVISQETGDKVAEHLFNIGVQLGIVKGKIAGFADSFKTGFSEMPTNITDFLTKLREKLTSLPAVGPIFTSISEGIQSFEGIELTDVVTNITELKDTLISFMSGVQEKLTSIPLVSMAMNLLKATFESLGGITFTSVLEAMTGLGSGLGALGEIITSNAPTLNDLRTGFNNLRGSVLGIGLFVASAGEALSTFFSTVSENVGGFIEKITSLSSVQQTFVNIREAVSELMTEFTAIFTSESFQTDIFENLKTTFQEMVPVIQLISATIGIVLVGAINILSGVLTGLPEIFQATFTQVTDTIALAATILGETASAIMAIIQGDWSGAWTAAKNVYQGFYTYFRSTANNIKRLIAGISESIGTAILNITELFGVDTSGLTTGLQNFTTAIENFEFPEIKLPDFSEIELPTIGLPDFSTIEVPKLGLPDISELKLPEWVWPELPTFDWPTLPTFTWPELPTFTWPTLPTWTWPTLPTFSWPTLPTWTWPSLPTFTWPKLPEWKWPSIPAPDWLRRLNPFSSNAMGTTYYPGGATTISERGGEVAILPGGTQILNNRETRQFAASGGGGPNITMNFYGPVDSMNRVNQIVDMVINETNRRGRQ